MSSLLKIKGEVIIGQNRTSYRCNTDRAPPDTQLVNDFGNQAVSDPVGATRAVMGGLVGKGFGFFECFCQYINSFCYLKPA